MGEDGREGKRIKTWGSFVHQATESPLVSATRVREARALGLAAAASPLSLFMNRHYTNII